MDAFETLGLPRRLTLGDDEIGAAFRTAGKRHHPDSGGGPAAFETVQKAGQTLLDPGARLRHWLELRGIPGELRGEVSSGLMDGFSEVGELLQRADALSREREKASSALAKAMLEGRTQTCRDELETMIDRLEGMIAERVGRFDAVERGEADGWTVARELGFLSKWRGQVRERFAALW